MAQFGRALRSGRRGRVFESRHPDHKKQNGFCRSAFYFLRAEFGHVRLPKSRTRDVGQNAPGERFAATTADTRKHNEGASIKLLMLAVPMSPRAFACSNPVTPTKRTAWHLPCCSFLLSPWGHSDASVASHESPACHGNNVCHRVCHPEACRRICAARAASKKTSLTACRFFALLRMTNRRMRRCDVATAVGET